MTTYCLPDFPESLNEYSNTRRKKCEQDLIKQVIEASIEKAGSGGLINGYPPIPIVKKRIGGSGNSRLYLLTMRLEDFIIMGFIHAKSGQGGGSTLTTEKQLEIQAKLQKALQNKLPVSIVTSEKNSLVYSDYRTIAEHQATMVEAK